MDPLTRTASVTSGCITLGSFTPGLTQCTCKVCRESPGLGKGGEQAGGAHTGLLAAPLQDGRYRDMAVIGAGKQLDCGKLTCQLLKCSRRYLSVPRIEQGSINRKSVNTHDDRVKEKQIKEVSVLTVLLLIRTNKQDEKNRPLGIPKIIPFYDLVNNKLY